MKKTLTCLLLLNVVYSVYLVYYKTVISCSTCTQLPVELPVNQIQLAFLALAASILLLVLSRFSSKSSINSFVYYGFMFFTVVVVSTLMSIQYIAGYIVCYQCLISEILFYIIFVVAVFPVLLPWLRQRLMS